MITLRFPGPDAILVAVAMASAPWVGAGAADAPPAVAPAPVSAEPQTTMSTYGDWTVRCTHTETPAPAHVCDIVQSLQVQGQQAPIAQIEIVRSGLKEPMRIVVQLPVNVSLPSSVRVAADDKDPQPLELSWRRCVPGGGFAETELKADVLKRYRAQTANGKMQFKDAAGREVPLPFSFRGLPQALDGLAKAQ
jgi:invasion protein IalB